MEYKLIECLILQTIAFFKGGFLYVYEIAMILRSRLQLVRVV